MTDPLALLPFAAAAGRGRVDGFDAGQLVAAGLTLLRRSAPLVKALHRRRAAILLPTSHRLLTALAACDGRGAVLVNPLAAPPEIAYQLDDANVGAVFTIAALAARLPDRMARVHLDDAPRRARVLTDGAWSDVDLGTHHGLALEGNVGADGRDEEAVIVYTSAMAGRPLGAILTHRNLIANARSTVAAAGIDASDHGLAVLPFSHLFGLTVAGMAPLFADARVTTMDRFQPMNAADALANEGVTMLVGVPAVFAAMLTAIERRGASPAAPALRLCICGGAALPVVLQDRWYDATGVELRQGYGLTEAGPVCLFNRVGDVNRRGTLGTPFPDVEVQIHVPGTGTRAAEGEDGEICVRGTNVFQGYVGGGREGLAVRDGWLHTGDRGVLDAGGTVTFRGLLKPMFTRNGFNIYPRELERVIGAMPGVSSVTVRAVPDATRENDIGLDVVGTVTVDDVKRWCEQRLSAYKQPSEIRLRQEG